MDADPNTIFQHTPLINEKALGFSDTVCRKVALSVNRVCSINDTIRGRWVDTEVCPYNQTQQQSKN